MPKLKRTKSVLIDSRKRADLRAKRMYRVTRLGQGYIPVQITNSGWEEDLTRSFDSLKFDGEVPLAKDTNGVKMAIAKMLNSLRRPNSRSPMDTNRPDGSWKMEDVTVVLDAERNVWLATIDDTRWHSSMIAA